MDTLENALAIAKNLNELGKKAAARGLKVYGHNHDAEFRTKLPYDVNGDGITEMVPAIEVGMLNTDPRYVTFEIDLDWAYEGLGHEHFGDLVYFLHKYRNRIAHAARQGHGRERCDHGRRHAVGHHGLEVGLPRREQGRPLPLRVRPRARTRWHRPRTATGS